MSPSVHCIFVVQDQEATEKALTDLPSKSTPVVKSTSWGPVEPSNPVVINPNICSLEGIIRQTLVGATPPNRIFISSPYRPRDIYLLPCFLFHLVAVLQYIYTQNYVRNIGKDTPH